MLSKMRLALLAIIFFIALQGVTAAQPTLFSSFYCATSTASSTNLSDCINSTLPFVFVALLLSFTMVAFAYLLGEVLDIQTFKGWYRGELWESVKSILIVGAILSIIIVFGALTSLVPGAPLGTLTNPAAGITNLYQNAYYFLSGYPSGPGAINYVNEAYNNLMGIAFGSEFLKGIWLYQYFTYTIPPVALDAGKIWGSINLGLTYQPFQSEILDTNIAKGATVEKDALNLLIFPMLIVTGAQIYLFTALVQVALGILLPLGLIFRATPFLRPLGASLIAMAIAMAIIYPALLALFNAPVVAFFSPTFPNAATAQPANPCPPLIPSLCSVVTTLAAVPTLPILASLYANEPPNENDVAAFNAGYDGALDAFFSGDFTDVLTPFFAYANVVALQFILFVLDLIVGIIVATNTARALGGSLRLGIGGMKIS